MRALMILATMVGAGCSTLLGIDDPSPADRQLTSIAITPEPLMLPLGVMQQLMARGTFSDGTSEDVTGRAAWSIASGSSISLSQTGLVQTLAPGASTVQAAMDGVTGTARAEVGTAAPLRVRFEIGDFNLMQQQRVRLKVTLVLTDNTTQDASGTATLTSDSAAIAASSGPGLVEGGTTAGTATITASAFSATPATIRATVGAIACHPVVNELATGTVASPADEYVELFNPCTMPVVVEGWTVVYRLATSIGATDSNAMMALTATPGPDTLAPGELRLYAGVDYNGVTDGTWQGAGGIMQENNGAVGLRAGPRDTGPLIDAIAYGTITPGHPFVEGAAAAMMLNGRSASRLPFDGKDDNTNSVDVVVIQPGTPRARNGP